MSATTHFAHSVHSKWVILHTCFETKKGAKNCEKTRSIREAILQSRNLGERRHVEIEIQERASLGI